HRPPALRLGRQRGGGGHDVLRQRRGQPDGQAGRQQRAEPRRGGAGQQRQEQRRHLPQDDAPPVEAVAQRRQQQQAGGVAELGQGGDQAGRLRAGLQVGAQHAEQRLGVVQRGDRERRAAGEQQHQRARQACGGRE